MHLPPHALNVLVPLRDVQLGDGPTQFRVGSHVLGRERLGEEVAPCPRSGDVIVYDYRIVHRGLANCGDHPRAVLYCTYGKPWWRDANKSASREGA